jgi:hypothetical protein
MATISKTETPTGQEETAILLEEYERRIATLQESLRQAGRIYPNEAVIRQEIKRVVEERDDLRRRLENADILIEHLKDENAGWKRDFEMFDKAQNKASIMWREAHPLRDIWPSTGALTEWLMDEIYRLRGLIDNTTDKQPEGDGDGEEVVIKNSSGGVFYVHPCKCGSKNLWYAKKDVLVGDSYEIMCNDCEFYVTSDTRHGVIDEWNRMVTK